MSGSSRDRLSRSSLLLSSLAISCAQATEFDGPAPAFVERGGAGATAGTSGSLGSAGTTGGVAGSATGGTAGTSGIAGSGGTGLTSDVFGDGGPPSGAAGATGGCEYPNPGECDFARVDGCCLPLACERANGSDVFNTYPIESCQALVACVQAHPGCSTAADPLCFQNEDPNAPCLMEGYQASHNDPEGPFAWTAELVRCVCGY
jgi:hypothetical protein